MVYKTAGEYWQARKARESRKAFYATLATQMPYQAPPPTHCKHCGAALFMRGVAAGRCTGDLTCPNAYTD